MSSIEKNVMGSVAAIYAGRLITGPQALKCYALVLSFAGLATYVSVSNVALNFVHAAQGGFFSMGIFLASAVLGTTLLVQAALVVGSLALASLCGDLLRGRLVLRSA